MRRTSILALGVALLLATAWAVHATAGGVSAQQLAAGRLATARYATNLGAAKAAYIRPFNHG
jgi:hypothetical protein